MTDDRDDPGIKVPPPLIYLVPLVLGLLLDRRRYLSFLPRGVARVLGWSLIGGGVVFNGWFLRTMRDADAPIRTDKPVPRLVAPVLWGYWTGTMVFPRRHPLGSS